MRRHQGTIRRALDRGRHNLREYIGACIDVTDQREAKAALREQGRQLLEWKNQLEARVEERTAELAEANKDMEAFTYSNLRAPLRHMESFLGLIEKDSASRLSDASVRYLGNVKAAAHRMGGLIDGMLVLSRLGRATLKEREVSLGTLVDEVRQRITLRRSRQHPEVEFRPSQARECRFRF